jgi:hypothetical protein
VAKITGNGVKICLSNLHYCIIVHSSLGSHFVPLSYTVPWDHTSCQYRTQFLVLTLRASIVQFLGITLRANIVHSSMGSHSCQYRTQFLVLTLRANIAQSSLCSHFVPISYSSLGRQPLWSSGQSSWLLTQRSWILFPVLPDFLSSSRSGTGSTQPCEHK